MAAQVALRAGDIAEATRHAAEAAAIRPKVSGVLRQDGEETAFDDFRDVDDLFGPVAQAAVAEEEGFAAVLEETAVRGRQRIARDGHAERRQRITQHGFAQITESEFG